MLPYEWFVKKFSYKLIARRGGLINIAGILQELESSQYWSKEALLRFQERRLKKILVHAYENTSFYHKRFLDCGFDPHRFSGIVDLQKIPLLSKEDIRSNLPELCARNIPQNQIHFSETGGTTGVKMRFARDNQCLPSKEAALLRFEKWAGWDIGKREGIVWPARRDYVGYWTLKAKIKNELYNRQVVFPAAVLDDQSIQNYLQLLNRKKPATIRAFTSPIYEIARYVNSCKLVPPRLQGIITTGEPILTHQREAIEKAFRCKVFDSYRSREGGPLAQECECHAGLHINAESLFVEIIPCNDMHSYSKDIGEIVITDLLNYGMPLIRYRMGDLGQLITELCTCGRGLPRLKNIQGRASDLFYSPDGKKIAAGSIVLYLVDEAPGMLGQVQIIQDQYDHLTIRMTADPSPTEVIKAYQRKKVKELFGRDMQVSFEIVDRIPREPSGKYQFTKCLLNV